MIYGMEMLENRELIDRRDGKVNVTITASDAVSGVKEFYVNIQNTDNTVSKTYHPDADGSIRMEITEDDALFSGDFTVFVYACDQVGNETEISEGTTEFGLEADIIRIVFLTIGTSRDIVLRNSYSLWCLCILLKTRILKLR